MKLFRTVIFITLIFVPLRNGYSQWKLVSQSLPNIEYYASSVVGNRAYFWGEYNTVIYTDDGGDSFSYCKPYEENNNTVLGDFKERGIAFADSLIGYIGDAAHGEFRTTDGGKSWVKKANVGSNIWLVSFGSKTVGWKFGVGGLYKTTDGGNTWTFYDLGMSHYYSGYFSDIYAVNKDIAWFTKRSDYTGKGEEIYFTKNSGIGWHQSLTNLQSDSNHMISYNRIKVTQSGLGIVAGDIYYPSAAIVKARSLILRTTDNGVSWDSVTVGSDRFREIISIGDSIWLIYGNVVDYTSNNEGDIQYRSIDYGKTWTATKNIGNSKNYNKFYTSVFLPNDSSIIISTAQGFFRSKDRGLTYQKIGKIDFTITNFAFDKHPPSINQLGVALISGKKYMMTTDGGNHWRTDSINQSTINQLVEVKIYNGVIYINGGNSHLYRSIDQGKTWSTLNPYYSYLQNLSLLNASTISVLSYYGVIVSTDSGSTWRSMALPANFGVYSHTIVGENMFFTSGEFIDSAKYKGFIYQTTDFGYNWKITDFPSRINGVQKTSSTNLLAFSSSAMYRSIDNGKHWKTVPLEVDYTSISCLQIFDSTRGIVWRDYYFLETTNGGTSWVKKPSSLPIQGYGSMKRMEYNANGDLYVLGANGAFFYSPNEISQTNSGQISSKSTQIGFSLKNYPNPFNPSTTIEYSIAEQSEIQISIYNTLGQKIAILVDEIKAKGIHSVEWNATQFSTGIYFAVMKAGSFTSTKKLLLIK